MENKHLYKMIIRYAIIYLLLASLVSFLMMQNLSYVYATLLGGILSILGFSSIIYMANNSALEGNVKKSFTVAYLVRYLIYFVCMFVGAKLGLNIISMLIGFLCINIGIKIQAVFERKEEN
ncbi:MAG: hypothetical protein EOM50_09490 [Erysipelotrichia bacterium]|nr:hypothetical protein [Erysipelotrichia bacterium]